MRLSRRGDSPSAVTKSLFLRLWFEEAFPRACAWLAITVYRVTGDWRGWLPLFARTSAHVAVIAVAVTAIGLSSVEWPA